MSQPGNTDPPAPRPAPASQTDRDPEQRRDAQAALDSFVEMGPQWQREVVDSFMDRVEATTNQHWQESEYVRQQKIIAERAAQKARTRDLVLALVFAVPLTGIATTAGLAGMIVCWAGIAAVVFALHSPGRGPRPPRELGR